MQKRTILLLIFSTLLASLLNSQTIYSDEHGVRLNVEIKDTGKTVSCENSWDRNYTDKPIKVWEVSLIFRNGSAKKVKPKLTGIATINVIPSDGKVLDYCYYRRLNKHGVDNKGQQLFLFTIFHPRMPIVDAGARVSSSAYLYLYSGVKPILESWSFPGYEFTDGSPNPKIKVNGNSEEAKEIKFKSINKESVEKNESKEKDNEYSESEDFINSEIKDNIRSIANIEIDSSIVDLKAIENAVEQNPDYYDELTSCMESGNAKYYRDKLENVSSSNLKAMQAYSWLSIFYTYQCECEIGSTRPEQLVKDINQLVTTFNSSTRNSTFAPLKKVYQCKKIESNTELEKNGTIENQSNSDAIKKVVTEMKLRDDEAEAVKIISTSKNSNEALARLKEKNIQKLNKYTLDALNKLTNEIPYFPFSGSDIETLMNGGSFKDVIKNYNLRASNKLALNLGLDNNQTQAFNIIATSENKEEMVQRLKENNIQQISQVTANGLNKMLGDSNNSLSFTSGDISQILNGNLDQSIIDIQNRFNQKNLDKAINENPIETGIVMGGLYLLSELWKDKDRDRNPDGTWESSYIKDKKDLYINLKHFYGANDSIYKLQQFDKDLNLIKQTDYVDFSQTEYVVEDFKNATKKYYLLNHKTFKPIKIIDKLNGVVILDNTKDGEKKYDDTGNILNSTKKRYTDEYGTEYQFGSYDEIIKYPTENRLEIIHKSSDGKKINHSFYYDLKTMKEVYPDKRIWYKLDSNNSINFTEEVYSKDFKKPRYKQRKKRIIYTNGKPTLEQIIKSNGEIKSEKRI